MSQIGSIANKEQNKNVTA